MRAAFASPAGWVLAVSFLWIAPAAALAQNVSIAETGDAGPMVGGISIPVTLDALPGDPDNRIVVGSHDGIAVAILSNPGFDALTIDPASLVFGSAHVATGAAGKPMAVPLDVDADGDVDLVAHFPGQLFRVEFDGSAVLRGRRFDQAEVIGVAPILLVDGGGIEGVGLGNAAPAREALAREAAPIATVFPNPSRGPITIALASGAAGPAAIEVLDVAGRRVMRETLAAAAGRASWSPARALDPGRYVVRIMQGGRATTRGVTVLR